LTERRVHSEDALPARRRGGNFIRKHMGAIFKKRDTQRREADRPRARRKRPEGEFQQSSSLKELTPWTTVKKTGRGGGVRKHYFAGLAIA